MVADLQRRIAELGMLVAELATTRQESNAPAAHLAGSAAGASTKRG
jgi:hypothetical protein